MIGKGVILPNIHLREVENIRKELISIKIYVCKTLRLYDYLTKNNAKYIRKQRDINNPKFNVFLFEWDNNLDLLLKKYKGYKK